MVPVENINILKQISEMQVDMIQGGVMYLIVEGDTFTWKRASKSFDLNIFQVGQKIKDSSIAKRAMKENKVLIENVPRSLYGIRLKTIANPIVNSERKPIGVYSTVFPKLHPVAQSFNDFAPILAEMFSEGAFLYITDLEKVAYRQVSKKFNISSLKVGDPIKERDPSSKVIKSKHSISLEFDSSVYGVPTFTSVYPLFSEENQSEVIATFGIVIPKEIASKLRNMSSRIEEGLTEIGRSVEYLTSSATNIYTNQQELNQNIKEIFELSEKVNELALFIQKISSDTNMLGLNASIEAARAGEFGKGFNIVAQQIRNLSEQSKSTVPQIQQLIDSIKKKVKQASDKSKTSLNESQEQASSTQEITSSIQEITSMSNELNQIATKI